MPYVASLHLNRDHEPVAEVKEVKVLFIADTRKIIRYEDKGWESHYGELFDTEEDARHSLSLELQWLSVLAREAASELLK
jgi:hypothetical protein